MKRIVLLFQTGPTCHGLTTSSADCAKMSEKNAFTEEND
uniref:Uncharacterized protein n=1 Tax=Arundo donax TaxID=35708 RepID=A0A0A9HF09_ARUDO